MSMVELISRMRRIMQYSVKRNNINRGYVVYLRRATQDTYVQFSRWFIALEPGRNKRSAEWRHVMCVRCSVAVRSPARCHWTRCVARFYCWKGIHANQQTIERRNHIAIKFSLRHSMTLMLRCEIHAYAYWILFCLLNRDSEKQWSQICTYLNLKLNC